MALADYRLCDVCDGKVFYDANLNYDHSQCGPDGAPKLDYLGDWAVICDDCAKTHKCVVVPRIVDNYHGVPAHCGAGGNADAQQVGAPSVHDSSAEPTK